MSDMYAPKLEAVSLSLVMPCGVSLTGHRRLTTRGRGRSKARGSRREEWSSDVLQVRVESLRTPGPAMKRRGNGVLLRVVWQGEAYVWLDYY
jgi:hypothetical protein